MSEEPLARGPAQCAVPWAWAFARVADGLPRWRASSRLRTHHCCGRWGCGVSIPAWRDPRSCRGPRDPGSFTRSAALRCRWGGASLQACGHTPRLVGGGCSGRRVSVQSSEPSRWQTVGRTGCSSSWRRPRPRSRLSTGPARCSRRQVGPRLVGRTEKSPTLMCRSISRTRRKRRESGTASHRSPT